MSYTDIPGNVTAPQGFRAAAMNCGVKPDKPDLVLIHSDHPAAAAATLTTNQFRAAPTYVTESVVADGAARTIVANSGNANCATGAQGLANAQRMGQAAAAATGVLPAEVVVCSTGVIGHQLPIEKIEAGIAALGGQLGQTDPETIARSIMTTDTYPKAVSIEFDLGGTPARIGGICKGAGMIHPNMATMLAFFTTDAPIVPELLRKALRDAVNVSFNCISVDGDQSTNDTVAILANGACGALTIECEDDPRYPVFADALRYCCTVQAQRIAWDGEGASKRITIDITGARTWDEARQIGRHLANYTLLKVAYWARDFNWGRIAAGAGAAGVPIDTSRVNIDWCGIRTFAAGEPQAFDVAAGRQALAADDIAITVDLGLGDACCTVWTCDLTPAYIEFNAIDEL
ncbi:MAG: bifunctional glutamate N-acetyltransferase/amino-acid acetyltransferase ArgJ [Armatimonadetes bacterium]|nr:bifunctional glutamate N-acetyltransferase/amino-acid acetyltransferase ArgJ [Armatimonadota bacterium]